MIPPAKDWQPADQAERKRAYTDLEHSLCVDASAGTGKTTLLINRILELVRNGSPLDKLAAITFTEKAAGELKLRLRDRIEDEYAGASGAERGLWQKARRELDRAQISTIHAFAAGILRMRPVEAGVDPDFEMLDELGGELFFDEIWEEWFSRQIEGEADTPRRALLLGLGLDKMKSLADRIYNNRDLIPAEISALNSPGPESLFPDLQKEIESLSLFAEKHCHEKTDNGYIFLKETKEILENLNNLSPERREVFIFRNLSLSEKGNRKNWTPEAACAEQKRRIKGLKEKVEQYRKDLGQALAVHLLKWLCEFVAFAHEKKKARGALDFQDLLILSRNLLRDHPDVRRYFQARFDNLLVDEFQDTDPLQAELVFYLSEQGADARDWKDVVIKPGKLFIVGDPKQSIYGFRRADLEVYSAVKQQMGRNPVKVSQNFRSSPSIIRWVNQAFSQIIQPIAGFQPDYEPLSEHPEYQDGLEHSSVMLLPAAKDKDEMSELIADEVRAIEAEAIAGLIEKAVSEKWPVRIKGEEPRALDYGHIAILFPKGTGIKFYQDALERRLIPYKLEGGKQFFERDEVRALRACLKAISDPEDQLALVAALRSFFFGVSDEELFLYRAERGEWNYLSEKNLEIPSIAEAFNTLRDLHKKRTGRSFALTIEDLLSRTYHRHLHMLRPRGQQAVFNLEKVMAKARAFEAQGITSFSRFAAWLEQMELEDREEPEMPQAEAEDKIVSLLTIHKAKGLEFPLVILANLASETRGTRGPKVIINRMKNRMEFSLSGYVASPGFTDQAQAEDKEKSESEDRRLLYVACTRARDYLVLPYFARKPEVGAYGIFSEVLPDPDSVHPGAEDKGMFIIDPLCLPPSPGEPIPIRWQVARKKDEAAVDKMLAEQKAWEDADKGARQRAKQGIRLTAPSRMFEDERPERVERESQSTRDRAREIGIVVHRVLEMIDPEHTEKAQDLVRGLAREKGLNDEATEKIMYLVENGIKSEAFRRAISSGRFFREVPYTWRKSEDEFSSGIMDMVFEDKEGLVIVDYKTDRLSAEDLEPLPEKYRAQGQEYRDALQALSGKPVKQVIFAFLHSGRELTL
jgi:ATP-dependent helicase/nuclease subunit A